MSKWRVIFIIMLFAGAASIIYTAYDLAKSFEQERHLRLMKEIDRMVVPQHDLPEPLYKTAETTDLIVESDIPEPNDELQIVGAFEHGMVVEIDVTSGDFDSKTWTSNFLLVHVMPKGFVDNTGKLTAEVVNRVIFDCRNRRYRFVNATQISPTGEIIDYIDVPVSWTLLNKSTMGTHKDPTVIGAVYKYVCPTK